MRKLRFRYLLSCTFSKKKTNKIKIKEKKVNREKERERIDSHKKNQDFSVLF